MLSNFFSIFKYHKKKIALGYFLVMIFLYFLFPFNDLGDLVTSKVSDASQGQVYLNFEKLDLSLIPSPGIALSDVTLETSQLPALKAGYLEARPSMMGLITFKPGISIGAEQIFGGDLSLSTRGIDKNKNGTRKQKIDLSFDNIKLNEIFQAFDLNIRLNGSAEGQLSSQVDIELLEQPKSEVSVNLSKVVLEETDLSVQGMSIGIPKISLNQLLLEAKSENGNLQISKLTFGGPGQDITGQMTGKMAMTFVKQGMQFVVQPGGFDFNLKFTISETLKQKLSSYLLFLQNYLVAQNTYSLRISGSSFYGVPQLTKGQ